MQLQALHNYANQQAALLTSQERNVGAAFCTAGKNELGGAATLSATSGGATTLRLRAGGAATVSRRSCLCKLLLAALPLALTDLPSVLF